MTGTDKMIMIDLAVPRDIDPKIAQLSNIELYDIDHLGGNLAVAEDNSSVAEVRTIIEEEIQEFERWNCVRGLMPKINEISTAASVDVVERLQYSLKHVPLDDNCVKLVHEAAGKAVSKVVENILLNLQKNVDTEIIGSFSSCLADEKTENRKDKDSAELPPRFPLFVDLSGKSIAVIGAGPIAMRRIKTLLSYPCNIEVIAPDVIEEIEQMQEDGRITLKKKKYEASDLGGAYLVVAATDDRELNHRIALDAGHNGQHCSIADCKEECTFYFPATVHYDGGVIGICGSGEDHCKTKEVAADIREFINAKEQI
jgi:glutamyl-tRNA reductase